MVAACRGSQVLLDVTACPSPDVGQTDAGGPLLVVRPDQCHGLPDGPRMLRLDLLGASDAGTLRRTLETAANLCERGEATYLLVDAWPWQLAEVAALRPWGVGVFAEYCLADKRAEVELLPGATALGLAALLVQRVGVPVERRAALWVLATRPLDILVVTVSHGAEVEAALAIAELELPTEEVSKLNAKFPGWVAAPEAYAW